VQRAAWRPSRRASRVPITGTSDSPRDRSSAARVSQQAGITTNIEQAQYEAALERVGASNLDGVMFAHALRDATPDLELTAEERESLWGSWWGAEGSLREQNGAAFASVWNQKLTPADRAALYARLTSRRVTEALIAISKKSTRW
jgi:hypothetical protein